MFFRSVHPREAVIVPYAWVSKVLKIPVFRMALGSDLVSRVVIAVHNFFSRACQNQHQAFRDFDPARAQRSVDRFEALGAKIHFVTPRDGKGRVQMMTFTAQDLEKKIRDLGGVWERRKLQGKEVFAVVPPKDASAEWKSFQEKLGHFGWREEEGVLVTCDCADTVPVNSAKQCFLYTHTTSSSFASDWKRAGFYLGAKQDLCFFDNGNTWKNSGRPPSEESFYLEIETVYNKIKEQYLVEHLWVGGSCGGAPVAAYLKRLLHDQGVNFFAEQSFSDLDDFTRPISPFFAPRIKGSLSDPGLPQNRGDLPPACQFSVEKLWKELHRYEASKGGKVVMVEVKDDEYISKGAYEKYLALARKVNTNVKHILYSSTLGWHHTDHFFCYEMHRREFLAAVFS